MAAFAESRGIKLMCYGTLLGGLLSNNWIGRPAPTSRSDLPTASLGKYYQFVTAWGDWTLFQELLRTLKGIAERHGKEITVANVAVRWVLQQQAVGAALLGMRLGHTAKSHIDENKRTLAAGFELTEEDLGEIRAVQSKARRLLDALGDCGGEYRR
jgi:aryl-alcohol dehydrogenase-like predicted oxidoreductase